MLKYDGIDYDLNSLFQFEMLKKLIEALARRQYEIDRKLTLITANPNINTNNQYENMLLTNALQFNDDELNEDDIKGRLSRIESKLQNITLLEQWIRSLDKKFNEQDNTLSALQNEITQLTQRVDSGMTPSNPKDKVDDSIKANETISNELNELKQSGKDDIVALEEKIFKKFNLLDTKLKQLDEDINESKYSIKTNVSSIDKNASNIYDISKSLGELKSNFENLLSANMTKFSTMQRELEQHLQDATDKLNQSNNDLINQLKELEEQKRSAFEAQFALLAQKNTEAMNCIKESNKKINDLESQIHKIGDELGIENIIKRITQLEEQMKTCVHIDDFEIAKTELESIKTVQTALQEFKQQQCDTNDRRYHDIFTINKRLETFNNMLLLLQTENSKHDKSRSIELKGGTAEVSFFNEALKGINIQLTCLQKDCDEFRRHFTDILPLMGKLASIKDLKNLEDVLKTMLDEYKLMASKRFADKIETQKSLKLLDTQIKHLIADYLKKNDKGDNWMLAAKPVGGYKCASCESYLGELNNKWEYLPWNKYPTRDFVDKSYRMGNGFSRMLEKLNLDVRKIDELNVVNDNDVSYEEGKDAQRNSSEEKKKRKHTQNLPKLKTSQPFDYGNNNEEDNLNKRVKDIINHKEPCLVKIMRKTKANITASNNFNDGNNNNNTNTIVCKTEN
jgi:hypothetical protein